MIAMKRGPLTEDVFTGVPWSGYGSCQEWADEMEDVLSFLQDVDRFAEFRNRLRNREWRGALAEARGGYYLHRIGFSVSGIAPQETSCPGDWEITWKDGYKIFVEVKGPTWEGELTEGERRGTRKQQPKYQIGTEEARGIDVRGRISCVIENSLSKFSPNRSNLIVVVDDLFFPINFVPTFRDEAVDLMKPYPVVDGIVWIRPDCYLGQPVGYSVQFAKNEAAPCRISNTIWSCFSSIFVPPAQN